MMRDRENSCEDYTTKPLQEGRFACCEGDGHYMCAKCSLLQPAPPKEESPDLFDEFQFEELETFYEDMENRECNTKKE